MTRQSSGDIPRDQGESLLGSLVKYILLIIGIILVIATLLFGGQIWFVYSIYASCLSYAVSAFGQDIIFSRMIAFLATGMIILVLPTLLGFIFLGRNRKQVLLGAMAIYTAFSFALYFGGGDVFFDRATGLPGKNYGKTFEGFKFSNAEDIDPQWGFRYRPVTPEIAREYYFWKKNGRYETTPIVQPGNYFHMLTGEPIAWYTERGAGEIEIFPLPGYDPKTGKALKPMSAETVLQYNDCLKRLEPQLKSAAEWEKYRQDYRRWEAEKNKFWNKLTDDERGAIIFALVVSMFLTIVIVMGVSFERKKRAAAAKRARESAAPRPPVFTLWVKQKESWETFNVRELRIWHEECYGGELEAWRSNDNPHETITRCKRCGAWSPWIGVSGDLSKVAKTALDGQPRLSHNGTLKIIRKEP